MANIITYTIANRGNISVLMNNTTNKFVKLEDEKGCALASLRLLQAVVGKMERNDDVLNIVLIPKSLGMILQLNKAKTVKANGYVAENGNKLSKEYVDLMVYINELREYLGTNNLVFKIQGGELVRANEKKMIDACWRQLDKVTGREQVKTYARVGVGETKPEMPKNLKAMAVNDFDI